MLFIQPHSLALSPVNLPYSGKPRKLLFIGLILISAFQIDLGGRIEKSILIKVKILLRLRALRDGFRENVQPAVSPEAFKLPVIADILGVGALSLKKQADQVDPRTEKGQNTGQPQKQKEKRRSRDLSDPDPAVRPEDLREPALHILSVP